MYYNIHTHHINQDEDVRSIVNLEKLVASPIQDTDLMSYSAGIHPWEVKGEKLEKDLSSLRDLMNHSSVVAIGECGLDKVCETPMDWQKKAFEAQVALSEEVKKPLIIHCVKAVEELLQYKKLLKPTQAWIIHGFRGKIQEMESLVKKGFFISIGPLYNEESLRAIPHDRLFLETDDSDYSIQEVYQKAASTLGLPDLELKHLLKENVRRVFLFPEKR